MQDLRTQRGEGGGWHGSGLVEGRNGGRGTSITVSILIKLSGMIQERNARLLKNSINLIGDVIIIEFGGKECINFLLLLKNVTKKLVALKKTSLFCGSGGQKSIISLRRLQ